MTHFFEHIFNRKIFMKSSLLLLATLAFHPGSIHGYAFNPWTTMTGEKKLAVNPFLYTSFPKGSFGLASDFVFTYGFSDKFDIFLNAASLIYAPGFAYAGSWIMPRVDLGKNNIIAVKVGYDGASAYAGPEYHFFKENEKFAFEANAYGKFVFSDPFSYTVGAFLAPVLKLAGGKFNIYCEVDPAYSGISGAGAFSLGIVPGICLNLKEGTHQISIAYTGLAFAKGGSIGTAGIGLWYWHPFQL
jgi:hypothetical protein